MRMLPFLPILLLGPGVHAGDAGEAQAFAPSRDGLATAILAVPVDSASAREAVLVAQAARAAALQLAALQIVDVESALDGADPAWRDKLAEARREKQRGDTALSIVDLPVAGDSYGRALVAFEQAAAGLESVSDIVDTLSAQATTFALQGDAAAARSSFDKALALDPGFRLPADAAPRARKVFDDVAKAGQGNGQGNGQRNGELTVYASTGAAEVWVDGVMRGATPLTVDVPVGRHLVRVHRDGYRAWGGAFDVKRNAETTAQAALKPTAGFAALDEILAQAARNPTSDAPAVAAARKLKVDRLLLLIVKTNNEVAGVSAVVVDGVAGRTLSRADKSFGTHNDFFARDLQKFAIARLRGEDDSGSGLTAPPVNDDKAHLPVASDNASDNTSDNPLPGSVIAGWVLVPTSIIPLGAGIGLGILTLNQQAAFQSRNQVDPELAQIKNAWLATSVGADVSYLVAGGMLVGGIALLVTGYGEMATREAVLGGKP